MAILKKPHKHFGHRARLKARFNKEGLDNFEPHNILELILFYVISQKDTNKLAHDLLDEFGSLSAVFEAETEELTAFSGITENGATLLRLIPSLTRIYDADKKDIKKSIITPEDIEQYITAKFIGHKDEVVYLMSLDNRGKILNCSKVHVGSINASEINIRKITHTVLKCNASMAILAHNHPGGTPVPSEHDIITTNKVREVLESIGVALVDHIIVGADSDAFSFAKGVPNFNGIW